MCDKCVELDGKIERYERMRLLTADQVTVDRINGLVAELYAQRAKFHPEKE
jgi:hypothetical protein